jgi:solute carrier family 45 protein 1/2/4
VLPQFLVTALSSIIFAILAPGKSVLGAHAPSTSNSDTNTITSDRLKRFVVEGVKLLIERQKEEAAEEKGYNAYSLIFQYVSILALSRLVCGLDDVQ